AGSCLSCASTPGSRTHRGMAFCRPLRGLMSFLCLNPRFADSPGDSVLSPAARARVFLVPQPRVEDSPGDSVLSPAARARVCGMAIKKPATRSWQLEACNQKPETRNQKPETKNHKPETKNQKPETRNLINDLPRRLIAVQLL